ncbi:MAG: phosphoenolpyruvate carboxylase, partial [Hyphomonas sp.]
NVAAGIGSSLQREMERLVDLIDDSPRMKGLILLATRARLLTSLPALRAYARVYDPGVWVAHSKLAEPDKANAYRAVYYALRNNETSVSMNQIANYISVDLGKFDRLLAQLQNSPSLEERHEGRLDLHVLHAVRQALIMKAFSIVGGLPRLSERHDASSRDLVQMIAELRISEAVELLREIFPHSRDQDTPLRALTETGNDTKGQASYGYDRIHKDIIGPLDDIDRILHGISLAVAHAYGAFG